MNRIKISPLATAELKRASTSKVVFKPKGVARQRSTAESSLFVPQHCESRHAYPLIVWLHGDAADSSELPRLMPNISTRNFFGVAPQSSFSPRCPIAWPNCVESHQAAYEQVMRCVDDVTGRFNINSDRIFLVGSGSGGTMAIRLAFERPEIFAGVMSIDGPLDSGCVRLRDLDRCRELSVFLAGFRNSEAYPETDLCKDLRLLHSAGFSTTVKQHPRQFRLDNKVLSDINRWIMEHVASAIR